MAPPDYSPFTFYNHRLHPDVAWDLSRAHPPLPPGANALAAPDGRPRLFSLEQLVREHHEDGALVCAVFSTYVFDNDWFLDTQDGFGHLFYPGPY